MTALAGSNTLTGLIPVIYEAMDVIPRELLGAIGAVQLDSSASKAGLNQVIRSPIVPVGGLVDIVPGVTNTNAVAQTIGTADLTISKSKAYSFVWAGEEQLQLNATGDFNAILANQFRQAFRVLGNAMEADIVNASALNGSRAIGTAGTTPFSTALDLSSAANSVKCLDDNGAPQSDRSIILGTTAAAKIRGIQSSLFKVNESGTDALLRNGVIGQIEGFDVRTSGQIKAGQGQNNVAVGTGAGYVISGGTTTLGQTSITVGTGAGTILAGDIVTIGANQYVVQVGIAAPGTFTISAPGMMETLANGTAVTVQAASLKNVWLQKAGFLLATRLPAMPIGGDSASDLTIVTDPISGLSFQVAMYKQYRQVTFEIAIAWGTKVLRPEYVGVLLG